MAALLKNNWRAYETLDPIVLSIRHTCLDAATHADSFVRAFTARSCKKMGLYKAHAKIQTSSCLFMFENNFTYMQYIVPESHVSTSIYTDGL